MARSRAREMASKRCLPWSEEQPQMDQEHVMFDAILPEPVVKLFRIDESVASNLHMKMQVKTSSPAPARTLSIKQEPEADVEPEINQEMKPEPEIPVSSACVKVQTDQVSGLRLKMSPSPRTVSIKQEPADHLKQEPADHLKQEPTDHLKQEPTDHLKQEPEDHLDLNQSVESSLWLKMSSARTVSIKQEPEVEGVEVEIGGPERCKVMYDCTADNEDELDLRKGDIVTIIRKETEAVGWWEGEVNGRRGFFPNNFVTLIPPTDAIQSAITSKPPAPGNHTEYCQVMFDCAADREDELELRKGDIITVISKETEEEGWWEGEVDGRRGFFPSNFVKLITPTDAIQLTATRGAQAGSARARQTVTVCAMEDATASCIHAHTIIMENTQRTAFDAAFKLKAIDLAVKEGNRTAARTLGINESMVRRWRRQREELNRCKKTRKAFRGNKSSWPELENVLEDWVNTQRADGQDVSTVQIRLKAKTIATEMNIEDFKGGPSWCLRFMRRKGLPMRARTTLCQQLHIFGHCSYRSCPKITQIDTQYV